MKYHKPYADRAKIFVAFDALKGLREALKRQERIVVYVPKADLAEDRIEEIDRVLQRLRIGDTIRITYYDHGEYVQKTGLVSAIDPKRKEIRVVKTRIPFQDIYQISVE